MTLRHAVEALQRWQGILSLLSSVVAVLLLVWVTLGFGFPRTPGGRLGAMEASIDTLHRADSVQLAAITIVRSQHRQMQAVMRILAIDVCLRRSQREWQMMQLPCDDILSPPRMERP